MLHWQLWRDLRTYYRGCQGHDLQEFYDLESRLPYFDHVSQILGAHKRRILLRWISEEPVEGPILELGSGIGTFARQLGGKGYRVVAVDISVAKTQKARRLTARRWAGVPDRVQHFVGDCRQLGAGTALDLAIQQACKWPMWQKFDNLLAADVLEHLPEAPPQTMQQVRALLTPQGRLFTSVPARLCVNDPGHFWRLRLEEWEAVFTACGLRIHRRQMSRLCWYGLPTPLPLAMVYELRPAATLPTAAATAARGTTP
jgi:SAM-dependent methyltransferase